MTQTQFHSLLNEWAENPRSLRLGQFLLNHTTQTDPEIYCETDPHKAATLFQGRYVK